MGNWLVTTYYIQKIYSTPSIRIAIQAISTPRNMKFRTGKMSMWISVVFIHSTVDGNRNFKMNVQKMQAAIQRKTPSGLWHTILIHHVQKKLTQTDKDRAIKISTLIYISWAFEGGRIKLVDLLLLSVYLNRYGIQQISYCKVSRENNYNYSILYLA